MSKVSIPLTFAAMLNGAQKIKVGSFSTNSRYRVFISTTIAKRPSDAKSGVLIFFMIHPSSMPKENLFHSLLFFSFLHNLPDILTHTV